MLRNTIEFQSQYFFFELALGVFAYFSHPYFSTKFFRPLIVKMKMGSDWIRVKASIQSLKFWNCYFSWRRRGSDWTFVTSDRIELKICNPIATLHDRFYKGLSKNIDRAFPNSKNSQAVKTLHISTRTISGRLRRSEWHHFWLACALIGCL